MNGTFIPIQLEKENRPQFLLYIHSNSIQFESKIEFDEIMFGFRSNLYFETVSLIYVYSRDEILHQIIASDFKEREQAASALGVGYIRF